MVLIYDATYQQETLHIYTLEIWDRVKMGMSMINYLHEV